MSPVPFSALRYTSGRNTRPAARASCGRICQAVPAHHLGVEPLGLADPGEVRRLAILEHEIRIMDRLAALLQHQPVGDRMPDQSGIAVEIFAARQEWPRWRPNSPDRRSAPRPCAWPGSAPRQAGRRSSSTGSRMASTFSTPRRQICAVASTMAPTPRSTATLFHGSPTQAPSISPLASASATNGGGIVTISTSSSGRMPQAASQ